jgi:hypothetical protein
MKNIDVNNPKETSAKVKKVTLQCHCERSEAISSFLLQALMRLLRGYAPRNDRLVRLFQRSPKAITAFSPEAHLIFRSSSLLLKQQGQCQHKELKNKKDMRKQRHAMRVDNSHG